jgi:hypothetical protein
LPARADELILRRRGEIPTVMRACPLLSLATTEETAMQHAIGTIAVAVTLGASAGAARLPAAALDVDVLATVHVTQAVIAGGQPLPPGKYAIRLASGGPAPLAGQSPEAQRWVEFVDGDTVAARDVAEVLRDDDVTPIGASARPVREGIRVEMLKGSEFLRISVKRGSERFLVHLTIAP